MSTSNRRPDEEQKTEWTWSENKAFETALAFYDEQTPERWHKVAACVPGKTVRDVMHHFAKLCVDVYNIEAGRIPLVDYQAKTNSDQLTTTKRKTSIENEHRIQVQDPSSAPFQASNDSSTSIRKPAPFSGS